jgi:26S proteasome regulatory subunit N3
MPSKTPHTNGTDPVENGINGTKDVEMKEDTPSSMKGGKGKKTKESDEEMTVVVPPSKGSKLSAPQPIDANNDVAMGESEKPADAKTEEEVDPVAKTISGMLFPCLHAPTFPS